MPVVRISDPFKNTKRREKRCLKRHEKRKKMHCYYSFQAHTCKTNQTARNFATFSNQHRKSGRRRCSYSWDLRAQLRFNEHRKKNMKNHEKSWSFVIFLSPKKCILYMSTLVMFYKHFQRGGAFGPRATVLNSNRKFSRFFKSKKQFSSQINDFLFKYFFSDTKNALPA